MARPKKHADNVKSKRLTVYLTPAEADKLTAIANLRGINKTKVLTRGLKMYIDQMENPPKKLAQAKHAEIMSKKSEQLTGFICSRGHSFFLEWTWPSPPLTCPCCGEQSLQETWSGTIQRGF